MIRDAIYDLPFGFQEGEKIIENFLEKVQQLKCSDLSEEAAAAELENLRREVKEKNNAYVEDVLARGT